MTAILFIGHLDDLEYINFTNLQIHIQDRNP